MGESWEIFCRFFPIKLITEIKNPMLSNILFLNRNDEGDGKSDVHFEKHNDLK